jgi:hypothetical protein
MKERASAPIERRGVIEHKLEPAVSDDGASDHRLQNVSTTEVDSRRLMSTDADTRAPQTRRNLEHLEEKDERHRRVGNVYSEGFDSRRLH